MIEISETCVLCQQKLFRDQIIMAIQLGKYTDDEFGGIGFERSENPVLYAHFECMNKIEPKVEPNV